MKRNLAFLLAFAMLVFSLTACGGGSSQDTGANSSNQSGSTGSQNEQGSQSGSTGSQNGQENNSAVTGDTAQNNSNHSNGTNSSTQNHPVQDGVNDIVDGMENAADDMTGQNNNSGEGGVSYNEMLNNGKLRTR